MGALRMMALVLLVLAVAPVRAAPIPDVAPWAAGFTRLALANDPDALLAKVREVASPRFNTEVLPGLLARLEGVVGRAPGTYAEQFDEKHVGTFLKRINVAVRFQKTFLFSAVTFVRDPEGWQMVEFDYNTNVNDILNLKWPD